MPLATHGALRSLLDDGAAEFAPPSPGSLGTHIDLTPALPFRGRGHSRSSFSALEGSESASSSFLFQPRPSRAHIEFLQVGGAPVLKPRSMPKSSASAFGDESKEDEGQDDDAPGNDDENGADDKGSTAQQLTDGVKGIRSKKRQMITQLATGDSKQKEMFVDSEAGKALTEAEIAQEIVEDAETAAQEAEDADSKLEEIEYFVLVLNLV